MQPTLGEGIAFHGPVEHMIEFVRVATTLSKSSNCKRQLSKRYVLY
jgi:hypothetical protein